MQPFSEKLDTLGMRGLLSFDEVQLLTRRLLRMKRYHMAKVVRFRVKERVAIVTLANPPVNAVSQEMRAGLVDVFDRISGRRDIDAVVLIAEGRSWPLGVDIRDYSGGVVAPDWSTAARAIETCDVPVVAALHGTALGAGFELALAAHYRVASEDTVLGLPEINLGLIPGGGGTQRLPRLIGAADAFGMMLGGTQIKMPKARELGLIDAVLPGHLPIVAVQFAMALVKAEKGPRPVSKIRTGFADMKSYQAEIAARKQAVTGSVLYVPSRLVDCVEAAALLPFEAGLAFETAALNDCIDHPQSGALIHAFIAERRASQRNLPNTDPAPLGRIGVVGGAGAGGGLAIALINCGLETTVVSDDAPTMEATQDAITQNLDARVALGSLDETGKTERMQRLVLTTDYNALVGTQTTIYAGQDTPKGASDALREVAGRLPAGRMIAIAGFNNDVDALGKELGRPADLIGLGFSSVADRAPLVELRVGLKTNPAVQKEALLLMRHMKKRVVWAGSGAWGIGPRATSALRSAAQRLLVQGNTIETITKVLADLGWDAARYLERLEVRVERSNVMSEDIVARKLLAAVANEGARLIDAGTACRAGDVDTVMIKSYGFPRWRGGPMRMAQDAGLLSLRNDLAHWVKADRFWEPSQLWTKAIKEGGRWPEG
jgi:3-hydroxyacyl-CoA dehydrogenase